jgi:hypothetical protein
MLRRVALVRTDVSDEHSASFIRVTRIGELGTTQAATSNRRTLRSLFLYEQPSCGVSVFRYVCLLFLLILQFSIVTIV